MTEYRTELVKVARQELGRPFRHHFKPENLCNGGNITVNTCMEIGMDPVGYDCMGLVIASICKVNGINVINWPREFRHSLQLNKLATDAAPEFGDVLLIESQSNEGYRYLTHMGLHIDTGIVLHANGRTKVVDESYVAGVVTEIKVADMNALSRIALSASSNVDISPPEVKSF